jgi:DUF1680 family protein
MGAKMYRTPSSCARVIGASKTLLRNTPIMPETPSAVVVDTSRSPHARLRPVPITAVTLGDAFWAPRIARNRDITLPSQFRHLEETGCIDNFRRTAGLKDVPQRGPQFADSDAYKWLEAAATALAGPHKPELDAMVDEIAAAIEGAQRPDGYLNTYFALERADKRWETISGERNWMHELYCAGHFFQAAIAHYRATGRRNLLDVAVRFGNHIADTFGPGEDQRHGVDGHPEIEMALVELYRTTGEKRFLETAQYFLETRRGMDRMNDCWQELVPFRELKRMQAHAVCAVYLTSGATDIAMETGDDAIAQTLETLWSNMTEKQMYVTGGIGQRYQYEAFGRDYELPNYAYAETCAAIGSLMWNGRMLLATGRAAFADVIEQTLYNGLLSGLSLDGEHYFYTNPLTDDGTHRREPWFGCACCPPNVARLLAQLPGYFYATDDRDGVYVNLYAAGAAAIDLLGGKLRLTTISDYPFDGAISLTIDEAPKAPFALHLRIPAWAEGAQFAVNGAPARAGTPGEYAVVERAWKDGDTVALSFPMPVRKLVGHPSVDAIEGRIAFQRGPLVYCLEAADNEGIDIRAVSVAGDAIFEPIPQPDTLGGIVALHGPAVERPEPEWTGTLYQPLDKTAPARDVTVTAIPYYAWANREAGPMRVWIKRA